MNRQFKVKECKHLFLVGISLILCAAPLSASQIAISDLKKFENRYIVIVGTLDSLEKAIEKKNEQFPDSAVVLSTYYSGLNPGWYIIVKDGFKSREEALISAEALKKLHISCYVRFTGEMFSFEKNKFRLVKLSRNKFQEAVKVAHAYSTKGMFEGKKSFSPDNSVQVFFREVDPTASSIVIKRGDKALLMADQYFQTDEVFWSQDSTRVAFVDGDYYAGGGDIHVVIVDTYRHTIITIPLKQLADTIDRGKRSMYAVSNLCWGKNSDRIYFFCEVNYQGYSGHPGIDANRRKKMGELFAKNDPVEVGFFAVFIDILR
jgi:hypothetical protein